MLVVSGTFFRHHPGVGAEGSSNLRHSSLQSFKGDMIWGPTPNLRTM